MEKGLGADEAAVVDFLTNSVLAVGNGVATEAGAGWVLERGLNANEEAGIAVDSLAPSFLGGSGGGGLSATMVDTSLELPEVVKVRTRELCESGT
jgi:hypothetical protein